MEKSSYPDGFRRLVSSDYIELQEKRQLTRHHFWSLIADVVWLSVDYTSSTEETVVPATASPATRAIFDGPPLKHLKRIYKLHHPPGVGGSVPARYAISTDGLDWFFELEVETRDFNYFRRAIESSPQIMRIIYLLFEMDSHIGDILEWKIQMTRNFKNIPEHARDAVLAIEAPSSTVLYSTKLDGVKYNCLLMNGTMFVPDCNHSQELHGATKLGGRQCLMGSVEKVDDSFVLIDLLYILTDCGIYAEQLSVMMAIEMMTSMSWFKAAPGALMQNFTPRLHEVRAQIARNPSRYDGYLMYTSKCIYKIKGVFTIDLKIPNIKAVRNTKKILNSLAFINGGFAENFPEFTLDARSSRIILEKMINQPKVAYKFFIIEFGVNVVDRVITLVRFRNDKSVPNRVNSLREYMNL